MNDFFILVGKKGVIALIGIVILAVSYKNSVRLFQWIENQTLGNRDYILKKLELLFIEIDPQKITLGLLLLSVVPGAIIFALITLNGNVFLAIIAFILFFYFGWKIPKPFMDSLIRRRNKKYQSQLIDSLNLLANGLRAGQSFPQALAMVVDEMPAPIAQEFNLVLQQNKLGVPLEECLDNLNERIPLPDNEMFVTSVKILRETGGNLAETFSSIVEVIRERIHLQRKIGTFVAQGMFQGATLFAMPFFIFMVNLSSDPKTVLSIFDSALGWILVVLALGLNLLGGYFILRIVRIKV